MTKFWKGGTLRAKAQKRPAAAKKPCRPAAAKKKGKAGRPRTNECAKQMKLVDGLMPLVKKLGRSFVRYDEAVTR